MKPIMISVNLSPETRDALLAAGMPLKRRSEREEEIQQQTNAGMAEALGTDPYHLQRPASRHDVDAGLAADTGSQPFKVENGVNMTEVISTLQKLGMKVIDVHVHQTKKPAFTGDTRTHRRLRIILAESGEECLIYGRLRDVISKLINCHQSAYFFANPGSEGLDTFNLSLSGMVSKKRPLPTVGFELHGVIGSAQQRWFPVLVPSV